LPRQVEFANDAPTYKLIAGISRVSHADRVAKKNRFFKRRHRQLSGGYKMTIGTALTGKATRALLLGSGELGKELTISLQRYGVEVIAVDRYQNAPAHHVAHRSYVIDMTDTEAVKKLIAMEQPNFIIPEIEAIATQALADIEAEGQCTVVPNARAIQLTMNRKGSGLWLLNS